jgi:hypothetical protein
VSTTDKANPYTEGQVDIYEHFKYEQTEVWVLFLAGDFKRPFPTSLKTTDPNIKFRFGIHVGMLSSRLVEIIGEPYKRDPKGWAYGAEAGDIYFAVSGGTVISIIWAPYLG